MNKQADAHVRARLAIARRVVDRCQTWGLTRSLRVLVRESGYGALIPVALEALADYSAPKGDRQRSSWGEDWGNKYGRYYPYGGAEYLGQCKDVPASVIHSIMCRLGK